jgi:hypothetical protein
MFHKRQKVLMALAGGIALVLGLFYFFCSADRSESAAEPSTVHILGPDAEPEAERPAAPPVRRPPRSERPTRPRRPTMRPPAPRAAGDSDSDRPECQQDADCRGPKQAACIRPSCILGRCVYDDSACECRTSAECDDNDPCTRNHCFVPTMKCIYIPEGCG